MNVLTPERNFPDITDEKKIDEILNIADRIDEAEQVIMVIGQTKTPFNPGCSLLTPDIIFATPRTIIIRKPTARALPLYTRSYDL